MRRNGFFSIGRFIHLISAPAHSLRRASIERAEDSRRPGFLAPRSRQHPLLRAFTKAAVCVWLAQSHATSIATSVATTVTLPVAGQWRCPPDHDCNGRPESLAYVLGSPQASLYLSFSGELKAPLSIATLQKSFRNLDLYLREDERGERWKLLGVTTDEPAEGSVRFMQLDAHTVRLRLNTRTYKLRTESQRAEAGCTSRERRTDCSLEKRIDQALELELIVPLGTFPGATQPH